MTIEQKLKDYIIEKYGSVRQFVIQNDLVYGSVDSILRRGIRNATWDNVKATCNALKIDVDALADGEIVPAFRGMTDEYINICALTNSIKDDTKSFIIDGKQLTSAERAMLLTGLETAVTVIRSFRK